MAAFFHDIGHLLAFEEQETISMGGFGVMHHEGLGEKLLIECGVPGRPFRYCPAPDSGELCDKIYASGKLKE